jgi:hypothetical protein
MALNHDPIIASPPAAPPSNTEVAPPAAKPPRLRRRIRLALIGAIPAMAAAGAWAVVPQLIWPSGEISDAWRPTEADGMSIELPDSFDVTTDAPEAAEWFADSPITATQETGRVIEQNPEAFALMARHDVEEGQFGAEMLVMGIPLDGTIEDPARAFAEIVVPGMEVNGSTILTNDDATVGTGGYSAVSITFETEAEGLPDIRGVSYVVDGGSMLWILDLGVPAEYYDTFEPVFERAVASLDLP